MSFTFEIVDGDVVITSDGAQTIEDLGKLQQDALKLILTNQGSNLVHRQYGSRVAEVIGSPIADEGLMTNRIQEAILDGLKYLALLQQQQALEQDVSSSEQLLSVSSVDVKADDGDERQVNILIELLAGTLERTGINIPIVGTE